MLHKIANQDYDARADWLNHIYSPRESKGYKVESQNDQPRLTWNLIWASLGARNNQIHEIQSIRGDDKMNSGRIYLRVAASWVWLRAKYPRTISSDSLTENRTPIRHQLRSLIGLGHVTAGNPSSSRIVIAMAWLGAQIAISLSQIRHCVAGP